MDALEEGFRVTLLGDACRPIDAQQYENRKRDIVRKGGVIAGSEEVL